MDKEFNVNDLRVATPCPAGWETMRGDDKKRFCDLCELNVYNIAEMTAAEVSALAANSGGRVCGRLYRRTDGTVITKDCPVGVRGMRKRAAKYAGAALAMVLGLFSVSFAQTRDGEKCESNIKITRREVKSGGGALTGVVTDLNGALVPGAKITVNRKNKKLQTVTTNEEGIFKLENLPGGSFDLQIEAAGFTLQNITDISLGKNETADISVGLAAANMSTMVIVGILISDNYDASPATDRRHTREKLLKLPINNR